MALPETGVHMRDICLGARIFHRPTSCKHSFNNVVTESKNCLHSLIRLDGKQVMITPSEVRRAHDHQPANITISWHVAHFGQAPWTKKAFTLHIRVTCTKARWRRVREPRRKAHHHQIRSRVCTPPSSADDRPLSRRRNKLEQQVFKMPFVHRHAKLSCLFHVRRRNTSALHRLTASFIAHVSAYLHLRRQGDHRYSNLVLHTGIDGVVNVSRVTGRQRAKDDENFARRMSGEVTATLSNPAGSDNESGSLHAAPRHLDGILQARVANGFQFRAITE